MLHKCPENFCICFKKNSVINTKNGKKSLETHKCEELPKSGFEQYLPKLPV